MASDPHYKNRMQVFKNKGKDQDVSILVYETPRMKCYSVFASIVNLGVCIYELHLHYERSTCTCQIQLLA